MELALLKTYEATPDPKLVGGKKKVSSPRTSIPAISSSS
jgi:hypothetical protein